MSRAKPGYVCRECGTAAPRWAGRCSSCGSWNTIDQAPASSDSMARPDPAPVPLTQLEGSDGRPQPTGVGELDRVLGGGLVPGSATLIGGEPGIGKSTLLLQALAEMARRGSRCLLVSAEESPAQVRYRAERMAAAEPEVWVVGETSMPGIEAAIDAVRPDVVVVDSVQTVRHPEITGPPGSITQVRDCAHRLVDMAKTSGRAMILIGHVTKEGAIAGPRVLEHLVDTVLSFEGDRHHALRLLRAVKNRFGSTGELGLFEMTETGLQPVADPSGMFLGDRRYRAPGSVVFPYMEGQRPLLVEIQALVAPSGMASPRRSASGFDAGRLSLLLAVLDRRAGVGLGNREVYVSVAGGVRVEDPAADLAVCLAVASAATNRPVDDDVVVLGEVGLGGEVRQAAQTPRRLMEAARLGFSAAVVPSGGAPRDTGLVVQPVGCLVEAVDRHLGRPSAPPRLRVVPG
jgi:DNA repair protein RadA/Sms